MAQQQQRQSQSGVPTGVVIAATICCIPCICIVGSGALATSLVMKIARWERPSKRRKREQEKEKADIARRTPRVMEPRLERHLTIGREIVLDEDEDEDENGELGVEGNGNGNKRIKRQPAKTEQQDQSPFFRLPLEVRRQIYEEAIAGYVVHMHSLQAYKKFSHMRCKTRKCDGLRCRKMIKQKGAKDTWGASDLMVLLKSCRRIYSEAIEILYKGNTFEFESLGDVLKLSLMILPQRMQLIRKVEWKANTGTGHTRSNKTPWLNCRSPHYCSCISCWPSEVYTDINSHPWVIYTWLMRTVEPALAQPRYLGTTVSV